MKQELKRKILDNRFIERLRELVVDRCEYDALRGALVELADEWRGSPMVDKEVVQELYVLAPVARGMASILARHDPQGAREAEDMATELDALVLECLATEDPVRA